MNNVRLKRENFYEVSSEFLLTYDLRTKLFRGFLVPMKPPKRFRTTRKPLDAPKSNFLSAIVRSVVCGLRVVEPYEYEFRAFAKGRWVRRKLIEICQAEFVANTPEYYEGAIIDGRITINGEKVGLDYVVEHNDLISHKARCVENPVAGTEIKTICETEEYLVVSKPSSVPIHACGGYRLNTLVSILQYERREEDELFPAHRIDRLTSGLVILGKTSEASRKIGLCMMDTTDLKRENEVMKEYLALVRGRIDKQIKVTGYIKCVDFRVGKFILIKTEEPDSKYSETDFVPVKYYEDRDETLLRCRPTTGRTHQIRLHLDSISHPIVNDVCYGGEYEPNHPYAFPQIPSYQFDNVGRFFCGGIFLHAYRYKIPALGLDLVAEVPSWASYITEVDN
jgi:RluA family pseudouridine synthase